MAALVFDIPIEGMSSNVEGLVGAIKQCSECKRLIHWSHLPGDPASCEPSPDACVFCDKDAWR